MSAATTEARGIGAGWAWAAWLLGSLFFFYAFALRVAPSVMVEELMRDFAVGAAILGNLSAAYFYAYAALQIPIGLMVDRLGPRRLMTGGAALAALGSLVFALGDSVLGAYVGRLLIGAGAAFSWVGTLTVAVQWFPPRRFAALAGGSQAFGMVGAVFGQAPIGLVVGAYGWRGASLALAIFGLALSAALWAVVRDRPMPAQGHGGMAAALRLVTANRQTWLCAVFGMAMVAPVVGFGGLWAVPYLTQTQGMSRAEAASLTSLLFIGWAVGAPVLGSLSDRLGRRRSIMALGATVAALSFMAVPLVAHSAPLFGALMALSGFAASPMVVGMALARKSNAPAVSGTALGFANTFVVASGALFQPLIGYLLDLQWDGRLVEGARVYDAAAYHLALAVLPLIVALGAVAALLSRDVQRPA